MIFVSSSNELTKLPSFFLRDDLRPPHQNVLEDSHRDVMPPSEGCFFDCLDRPPVFRHITESGFLRDLSPINQAIGCDKIKQVAIVQIMAPLSVAFEICSTDLDLISDDRLHPRPGHYPGVDDPRSSDIS